MNLREKKCLFSNKNTQKWICGNCEIARGAWFGMLHHIIISNYTHTHARTHARTHAHTHTRTHTHTHIHTHTSVSLWALNSL